MSSHTLFRWAAVALMVAAVSLAIGLLLHPAPPYEDHVATTHWGISHFFYWLGAFAGMGGMAGLYLRQREAVGVLGFAGILLAVTGLGLIANAMYFEAFLVPSVAARAPELFVGFPAEGGWGPFLVGVIASGLLYGLGFLLFGIAMLRVRIVPRWPVLLAIIGGIPFAVNFLLPRPVAFVAVIVQGIGLIGLGYALWKSPAPAARRPPAVATPTPAAPV